MAQQILETLLDRVRPRVQAAEAFYLSSEDTPVEFENNRLKSLQTRASEGIALRVMVNDRMGFASSTDLSRLEDLGEAAIQTATIGEAVNFDFADQLTVSPVETDFTPPRVDHLVTVGEKLIHGLRDYNPEILVSADFHVRSIQKGIATTGGVVAHQARQLVTATLGGNLVQGEDFLQAYAFDVVRDREPDYESLLQKVIQKYRWAENLVTIESGSMPVFFTPRVVASVLAGLFDTVLSGQSVSQKASPLAGKEGQKLFDDRLTIYEDPTQGVSASAFDDEGTPTQGKTFIDRGVVQGFYWDRRWAALGGVTSTGNGFRGGLSRPTPDTCNLCFAPGSTPSGELIRGMKTGLIVDQVLGAGQSNQLAGEFSINLELGYKVVDGEIVGRVKNTMVASSIFEAFAQVRDLSSDREWVGGNSLLPGILFDRLGVASRH